MNLYSNKSANAATFVLLVLACLTMGAFADPAPGDITLVGVPAEVLEGGVFVADFYVHTGTQGLALYDFNVSFDPGVLALTSITGGTAPGFTAAPIVDATTPLPSGNGGLVHFNRLDFDLSGPTGNLLLARLHFEAVGAAGQQSNIMLTKVDMRDISMPSPQVIPTNPFTALLVSVKSAACIPDLDPPAITVLGDNPATVSQGSAYVDAGATALDGCDGDLTAAIVVGGDTVNTSVVGTYVITYNVSDAAMNAAPQMTRTVHVVMAALPLDVMPLDDISLSEGASYDWHVVANNGVGTKYYQWRRLEGSVYVDVVDGAFGAGVYGGATTDTLKFMPFSADMAGMYVVVVSDDTDTVSTPPAAVTLLGPAVPASGLLGLVALCVVLSFAGAVTHYRRHGIACSDPRE